MFRPMPPIPMIPSSFPSGSWPTGEGSPRHSERLRANMEELKLRKAPIRRKTAVSAVESSTAVGTLET